MSNIFVAGRDKARRRKDFLQQDEFASALQQEQIMRGIVPISNIDTSRSVFRAGRAKAERRKAFTTEAKKAGKKAGHRRITKDPKVRTTATRGRRPGQKTGATAGDLSKAELYKQAMAIKKAGKLKGNMGAMSKKELQAFILKHDNIMIFT